MRVEREEKRQAPLCAGTVLGCLLYIFQNHPVKLVVFAIPVLLVRRHSRLPAHIRRPFPHPEEQKPGSVPSLHCFIACDLYTSSSLCASEL